MPIPQGRSVEAALATKAQVDLHFKTLSLRDKEFHRQKLVLIDKELHIKRKNRALDDPDEDDSPLSAAARARSVPTSRSLKHSRSCPGSWGVGGASSLGAAQRGMMGASRTRFSAGVPLSHHPAMHPGAFAHSPENSPQKRGSNLARTRSSLAVTWSGSPTQLEQAGSSSSLLSPPKSPQAREMSSTSRSMTTRSPPASAPCFGTANEDPFLDCGPSAEELLFDDIDEELARTQELRPRPPAEPPGTIERLGDMMALLGPRYKTLPRGMVWEKAVHGDSTPLERQQKRLGDAAPKRGLFRVKRPLLEDQADLDHEVGIRVAWLKIRGKERARHALALKEALGSA